MNGTIDESESFAFYTPSLFALYQPCFAGRDYQLCLSLAVYGQAERPAAQPDKLPPVQLPALPELRPVRSDGIHRKERKGRKE